MSGSLPVEIDEKLILTDVDGVLLNWRDAMNAHIRTCYDYHVQEVPDDLWSEPFIWNDDIYAAGLGDNATLDAFNSGPMFSAMHPHADAIEVLPRLHRNGWRIVGITSAGGDAMTAYRRRANLDAVFGPIFESVICLPPHTDKTPYLRTFPRGVWVEDTPKNALAGLECGHVPFLMTGREVPEVPDPRIRRVDTWREIASVLDAELRLVPNHEELSAFAAL